MEEETNYAEVLFFFRSTPQLQPCAVIQLFGPRDMDLWNDSSETLWACSKLGDEGVHIINATQIEALVSMQKLPPLEGEPADQWFVVEKSVLETEPS